MNCKKQFRKVNNIKEVEKKGDFDHWMIHFK